LAKERPRSVVDIGCGDGALLFAIEDLLPEAKMAGTDLSAAQIEQNRAVAPHIEWAVGDVEEEGSRMPGRWEAIVCSEVIEHLADPLNFLRQVRRLAAEDAVLILSTQSGRVNETERRVGHLRHFSAAEMRSILEEAQWTPVRVWNAGFPFQDLSKYLANVAPNMTMKHFAEQRYGPLQRFVSFALRALFHLNSNRRGAQLFAIARTRSA
jgi:2-polyprenyl-3-methyl-5-hydroxy-6-metoxy-1,4-benzoquinol methylase